jgi:transposase
MRRIMEALSLVARGLSYREIAQSVGSSASMVQSYVVRAQTCRREWPLPREHRSLEPPRTAAQHD